MLAPGVRFEGFTATDWIRVLSLFRPRGTAGEARDPERPRGGVIAVHAAGRLRKLIHTQVGRLQVGSGDDTWPMSVEALAARHHASWAVALELGTLEAIMERFGARVQRGDDLTAQALLLMHLFREEHLAGRIELWPRRLRGVPTPLPSMVRGTIEAVCAAGRTLVVGLFEGGELWTSVALRRDAHGVDLILGPDEVREDMGLLSGDWRRDYRHLARAIEQRAGPLSLGCFAEAATVRSLEVDPSPGAWARAVAVRDVILSPVPPALAIPLGIDAGWAALTALRAVAERMDPASVVVPAVRKLLELTSGGGEHDASHEGTASRHDVASMLGFHPLDLLRRLLSRD